MLSTARSVRHVAVLAFSSALFACSSEAIDRGQGSGGSSGATAGNSGSSGASGSSGTSGRGGSSGTGTGTSPDYTASPCYGESATTNVYDLVTHGTHPVTATCRAEGDKVRLYVADELWETKISADAPVLGQGEVDAFMARYELTGSSASTHPELGILPTDELVFGSLTDIALTDGKLDVFVIDSGGAGDGYLCGWCTPKVLHLDGPSLRSLHTDKTLSIAAHESFHAIHRGYDPDEDVWVDETLAQSAMIVNGFYTDHDWVEEFMHNTNQAWGPGVNDVASFDYGAGLLFGTYLFEHGGTELLNAITHEPANGWTGIDRALETVGDSATGYGLFQDMAIAAFLNDADKGYGFRSIELDSKVLPYDVTTGMTISDTLEAYGLMFVTFDADATSVTVDAPTTVSARLVVSGSTVAVQDVPPGDPISLDEGKTDRVLVLTTTKTAKVSISAE
ncbi:MAG TPA: hypothetical protein VFV94_02845 [Polyangiaceae bacterium]|nr:hypothetical protein [Polyangiaceae bacterium]